MVIEDIEGYTNSQTWEAWKDSINVLWDNTEVMFLLSVTVSLGAVLYTLMNYPRENQAEGNNSRGYKAVPGESDKYAKNNRINKKSEVIEETSLPPEYMLLGVNIPKKSSNNEGAFAIADVAVVSRIKVTKRKWGRVIFQSIRHAISRKISLQLFKNTEKDSSSVLRSHTKEITQEIEKQMSEDEKRNEREAQSQQLAAIYKLMQDQQEKFGQTSIDDIKDQMKFYCR